MDKEYKDVLSFEKFRNSKFSGRSHYLVVGHPISHSLSPLMHNIALQHYKIDAEYFAIDLSPASIPDFTAWINRDAFRGCNITIPYKQQLLPVPDKLSTEANTLGAINTIAKNEEGTVSTGYNTDIFGFQQPLLTYSNSLDYGRAIVFGTGGASLAVQYALWDMGFEEIILVSRSPGRVQPLQNSGTTHLVDYTQWQAYAPESSLAINTTPLGMGKLKGQSVISDDEVPYLADKICYDLVYNPLQTRFLRQAKNAGAETINGLDMLIHQGSRSFEIWAGHPFPHGKVKQRLLKYLG